MEGTDAGDGEMRYFLCFPAKKRRVGRKGGSKLKYKAVGVKIVNKHASINYSVLMFLVRISKHSRI